MSAEPDPSAGIIARLQSEAQLVDQGGFSLEPAAARRKLAERQLVSPQAWVLLVIEAAELAGMGRVDMSWGIDAVTLDLHGPAAARLAPVESLAELFAWVFMPTEHETDAESRALLQARQLLGLGVNAASAAGTRAVSLEARSPTGALRMTLAPGRDPVFRSGRAGPPRLRIRAKLFARENLYVAKLWIVPREAALIIERCGYGSVPIYVLGRPIPAQPRFEVISEGELVLDGRQIGRFGRTRDLERPTWFAIAHGVEIETGRLEHAGGVAFEAGSFVLITDGFARDLSLTKVVRDPQFARILETANREIAQTRRVAMSTSVALATVNPELAVQRYTHPSAHLTACIWTMLVMWTPIVYADFGVFAAATMLIAWVWATAALIRRRQVKQLFEPPPQPEQLTMRAGPRGRG